MRKEILIVGILFLLEAEMISGHVLSVSPDQAEKWYKLEKNFQDQYQETLHTEVTDTDVTESVKPHPVMEFIKGFETDLENTDFNESALFNSENKNIIAYMFKPGKRYGNLTLHSNDDMAGFSDSSNVFNKTVKVVLPEELVEEIDTQPVIFCLMKSPYLFENISQNRLIGLSVGGMNVSGLKSPVKISVQVEKPADRNLTCAFYNWTSSHFEKTGCKTEWSEENWIDCYCDHLTYFAILMVSPKTVSNKDSIILTYISVIGCSLSLLFLTVLVLLYFIKWRAQADHSQQIHISLAVALILLNLHYLMVDRAVNVQTACVYVAVLIHYSLMATFTWTAIEGFHLYLLFLRVFNIYIRRYILKLSLVGWGVPAVVVALIFIIDKTVYLSVGPSSNQTCYINSDVVKYCTTLGYFSVIFVFNLSMLVVVVRNVCCQRSVMPDPNRKRKAKNTCTVLGITCLLGISWSLSLLCFGNLTTVGIYVFSIFNTLLGFFIFIWFCIYKCTPSGSQTDVDTHTSSTSPLEK